jgi:shikimate kinase
MKTGIALIGFMGTGKTTVGRILAAKLGKAFVELDAEIEKTAGKSVADIFRDDGEAHFRELEKKVTKTFTGKKNIVIACGGGIVLDEKNIFRLQQECVIVCLSASLSEIMMRTSGDKRPLLNVADKEKRIQELLESRSPLYQKAAEITINTSGSDAPGVVQKILNALDKYENRN